MNFSKTLHFTTAILAILALALYALFRLCPTPALEALTITAGTFFYHFAMRLLVGAIVPGLIPAGAEKSWWFREKGFEPGLYKALRVKAWKKRMPTYAPEHFDLRRHTPAEIVHTCCASEAVHEVIMVLSFMPVLAVPAFGAAGVFWGTSVMAALFDGCFVILQRYNRPRLLRILEKERARR